VELGEPDRSPVVGRPLDQIQVVAHALDDSAALPDPRLRRLGGRTVHLAPGHCETRHPHAVALSKRHRRHAAPRRAGA
jgi:hypothetical protein